MIYRWLGFLGSNILSSLHLSPSLVSISFIHDTQDDNLKTGGRGRGEMQGSDHTTASRPRHLQIIQYAMN
jgi:hypothetical protein